MATTEETLKKMRARAWKLMRKYKQYKGHWDKYKLGRIRKDIFGKYRNLQFKKGEVVMYNPKVERFVDMYDRNREMVLAWCWDYAQGLQIDVSINLKDIEPIL